MIFHAQWTGFIILATRSSNEFGQRHNLYEYKLPLYISLSADGHICYKRDYISLHVNLINNSKTKFRDHFNTERWLVAAWKQ